jgi:predicted DNA-binding transcriptional regulator AlpA
MRFLESDRLLHTEEAARYLSVSPAMLERLRWLGDGPPYIHPTGGRIVRYRLSDLQQWLETHRVLPKVEARS